MQYGDYYQEQKILPRAKAALKKDVAAFEDEFEYGSTLITLTKSILSSVYLTAGELDDAIRLERAVIDANTRPKGANHPDSLISTINLANMLRLAAIWQEAEDLLVEIKALAEANLAEDHAIWNFLTLNLAQLIRASLWLTSKSNLALIYLEQRRDDEAETEFFEVMEESQRIFGAKHPDALTSMANMVSTYQQQGRWKELRVKYEEVVRLRTEVHGRTHPYTLRSSSRLATSMCYMGEYHGAEKLQRTVVDTWKSRAAENEQEHPDSMKAMVGLSTILYWRKNFAVAEDILRQILEEREGRYGRLHQKTIVTWANLAAMVWKQNCLEEAKELYEDVLKQSTAHHGEKHRETLHTASNLGNFYRAAGQLKEAKRDSQLGNQYARQ
ncbi:hypothetical protein N0V83_009789 [Neocucurbitaria cava]|uniref:Kinesin light chain n=1 Tax=Neocucurbitaria cava TaxID=798079 RepID=A0A9W9CI53_9PLEO|nr:hypothetical protein N0V83_009789 [Neocucurbitaria cava]